MSNDVKQREERTSLKVDPELLDESPLTPGQKEILRRIDVQGDTVTKTAKDLKRSKGTISKRHKTALKRYSEWVAQQRQLQIDELRKLEARLNARIEALEKTVGMTGEYAGYLGGLKVVADEIGSHHAENCVHATNGHCKKWFFQTDPKICGICGDYSNKTGVGKR